MSRFSSWLVSFDRLAKLTSNFFYSEALGLEIKRTSKPKRFSVGLAILRPFSSHRFPNLVENFGFFPVLWAQSLFSLALYLGLLFSFISFHFILFYFILFSFSFMLLLLFWFIFCSCCCSFFSRLRLVELNFNATAAADLSV